MGRNRRHTEIFCDVAGAAGTMASTHASVDPSHLPAAGRLTTRDGCACRPAGSYRSLACRALARQGLQCMRAAVRNLGTRAHAPPAGDKHLTDGAQSMELQQRDGKGKHCCRGHVDYREPKYHRTPHQLRTSSRWMAAPTKSPERPVPADISEALRDAAGAYTRPARQAPLRDVEKSWPAPAAPAVRPLTLTNGIGSSGTARACMSS